MLARRRELVDSATQMMVADEVYDGKPCIDLSEMELTKGLETFAGVDVQQTSDVDFCRQIFRVLKWMRACRWTAGCSCKRVPSEKTLLKPGSRTW